MCSSFNSECVEIVISCVVAVFGLCTKVSVENISSIFSVEESFVYNQKTTWRSNPKDHYLNSHRRENFKSYSEVRIKH
jgi:hypothetical protein